MTHREMMEKCIEIRQRHTQNLEAQRRFEAELVKTGGRVSRSLPPPGRTNEMEQSLIELSNLLYQLASEAGRAEARRSLG